VSQTITVSVEAPLVESTNAELGGTLQNTIIENLPLNGRNFENLLTLRPGVEIYVGGGGWTQSTNGIRPHDNVYLVDGVNSNDPWMAQSIMNAAMAAGDAGTILPVDAIDEFRTEINPPAQYGWKPGAIVSVGIKSGTNDYHGTGYAYGRSDAFDARNYFNPDAKTVTGCVTNPFPCTKAPLSLEQFGATFGGPLKKDKLFYFMTFEEQRYSVGNPTHHKVPATSSLGDPGASLIDACNAARTANTLTALSAQLAGLDPATCAPVSGQPTSGFQGLFPVSATGSLNTTLGSTNRIDSGLVKVNYHLNSRNMFSGMYFISPGNGVFVDNATREVSTQWLTAQYARSQVGSGNWVWTPNSHWVNEARVGYSHYYQVFQSVDHSDDPANYKFNGSVYHMYTGQTNPAYFGFPRTRFSSFSNLQLGIQWPKTVGPDSVLQIVDQVSYLHGTHAFKFGGEILRNQSTSNVTDHTKGPLQFGSLVSFFNGTPKANPNAGFLTGDLLRHLSYQGYAAFLQDDWRVAPRLTVNLGLRYELNTVPTEDHNLIGNFDPTSATGLAQVGKGLSSLYNGDHNNFAPRVGIAWNVRGDGKTVIRAGGGIVYEQISLDAFNGQANFLGLRQVPTGASLITCPASCQATGIPVVTPGTGTINVVTTDGVASATAHWPTNSATNPLYSQVPQCGDGLTPPTTAQNPNPTPDAAPCTILGVARNLRTPYVSTWTLGIQRAITNNMSLEVAYVGNHGTKLLGVTNVNQPAIGTGWGNPADPLSPAGLCLASRPSYGNCSADGNAERLALPFTQSCGAPIGTGTGTGKCFPYLAYIDVFSNRDKSNYNGLQVTLTQRTSHGLSFTAGYTYSHALDDNGDNEGNGLHTPINNSNPRALYASSDYDIRHRFTLSATYAIPGKRGFGQILQGWSLNSIVTIETGSVWGVNDQGDDLSGTNEMANLIGSIGEQWVFSGSPADFTPVHGWTQPNGGWLAGGGGVPYFAGTSNAACLAKSTSMGELAVASLTNLGCFAVGNSVLVPQAYGTLGTTGRNIFRDQGFKNLDMSVSKEFKFKERLTAQFRAEIFNVFNHPWFANAYGGPGGQAADPSAGPGYGFV
ncbi:MAG TPA: TonB-dependent receptor, partial [Blastocatellia bacterium]